MAQNCARADCQKRAQALAAGIEDMLTIGGTGAGRASQASSRALLMGASSAARRVFRIIAAMFFRDQVQLRQNYPQGFSGRRKNPFHLWNAARFLLDTERISRRALRRASRQRPRKKAFHVFVGMIKGFPAACFLQKLAVTPATLRGICRAGNSLPFSAAIWNRNSGTRGQPVRRDRKTASFFGSFPLRVMRRPWPPRFAPSLRPCIPPDFS